MSSCPDTKVLAGDGMEGGTAALHSQTLLAGCIRGCPFAQVVPTAADAIRNLHNVHENSRTHKSIDPSPRYKR